MAKRPALGKGIGALIQSANPENKGGDDKYRIVPIEKISPHKDQPRKEFDDTKLNELAASIKEKGIIQPIVVRQAGDGYQIIAGERRWRASQRAELHEVPVVIQEASEESAMEMALIENIQREDLNPIEEADAYRYLMDSFSLTQEEVARRVGKERSTVTNFLRLLRLPDVVQDDLRYGSLAMGHARALLSLESDEDMEEARDQVVKRGLSVRETESLVKKIKAFDGTVTSAKKPAAKPVEVVELENKMKRIIGTQVKITPKGRGGKVEIHFTSPDELDTLMGLLGL